MTSSAILIPARYASTRFPGKPLAMLDSVPMIKRVYDACVASKIPTYVLTDDIRIANVFENAGVIIDYKHYENGTERCAGAIDIDYMQKYDQFINVQGDMPDVTVEMINSVAVNIQTSGVATAYTDMDSALQSDPNSVKVVHNNVYAHWFGRGLTCGAHHLGIYGYSKQALAMYRMSPSAYELHEGLEQLRWLHLNYKVSIAKVDFDGIEINTPEDMEKWNESR